MTDLSVHLLSGIRVLSNGVVQPVTSRRQRAVMAALGLRPGRSVSVEELIDALWGDDPPDGARSTLQSYVSRLRSTLGDDAVAFGPAGYRLGDGATSDVEHARRLADHARTTLAEAPDRAAELAHQALALWEGRALADLADDPWFAPAAAGLEELRANLLDLAGEALLASGRAEEAIELLEPAARADALREPTHVLLADALGLAGRQVDAVRLVGRYRRRLREETGLEPGADLVAAERRALAGAGPAVRRPAGPPPPRPSAATVSGAVLARPSRLIGRDGELARLRAAVETQRLVSVVGPGGVGKTRLVAELVASHPAPTPAVVVELAPVVPGEVCAVVGATLHVHADRPTPADLAAHLRDADVVMVLDNVEHVLVDVRELARTVLAACPGVAIVVTSRRRVDLAEEHVHTVAPLSTDGDRAPALELFVERLGRVAPSLGAALDDTAVRDVCARLDGLPLALELAASRAAVLGVDGLRDRLDAALDLVAGAGDGHRHASLREVVSWSYELLDEPSRRLLSALGVFEGEFDLAAAERVGSAVLGQPASLLIGRLVDASLLASGDAAGRYRLLEMIRQFALERLLPTHDAAAARSAHVAWVVDELTAIADVVGPDEPDISARLDALRAELRGAMRWSRATGDGDLASALVVPLATLMLYRPDVELVGAGHALARAVVVGTRADLGPQPARAYADALAAAGARLAFLAGDLDDSARLADAALAGGDEAARPLALHACAVLHLYHGRHAEAADTFAAALDEPAAGIVDRLDSLGGFGLALCYDARTAEARAALDQHRAIAHTVDSDTYRAFGDYVAGEIALASGDVDAAADLLRRASDRAWAVGATFVWGIAATVLAAVVVRHRPVRDAQSHLPILVERWRITGTWTQAWTALRLVAELLARHDGHETAALILLAAERDPAAPHPSGEDLERHRRLHAELRTSLGDAAYDGIAAGVERLSRHDVVRRALGALGAIEAEPGG